MKRSINLYDTQYREQHTLPNNGTFNRSKPSWRQTSISQERVQKCVLYIFNNFKGENNQKALESLCYLVEKCKTEQLFNSNIDLEMLIRCVLHLRFNFRSSVMWSPRRTRKKTLKLYIKADNASRAFFTLIKCKSELILITTKKFFMEYNIWSAEIKAAQFLKELMCIGLKTEDVFFAVLENFEKADPKGLCQARNKIRILYELLLDGKWEMEPALVTIFVKQLIRLFYVSVTTSTGGPSSEKLSLNLLGKGFEICLRALIEKVSQPQRLEIIQIMVDWIILNKNVKGLVHFAHVMEFAANLYKADGYLTSFSGHIVINILEYLVSSEVKIFSITGVRLIQLLLNRNNPVHRVSVPTVYFEFNKIHLGIGTYSSTDKEFYKKHREVIHKCIMKAVANHCTSFICIESIYSLLATISLEIPCGFTSAAIACLSMTLQEFALTNSSIPLIARYRIHAMVMSVLSLICWIHKPEKLYAYVNSVMYRRSMISPHLNPPLKYEYGHAVHHIFWDEPKLFFEDWELRYGLWKHFHTFESNPVPSILKKRS